MSKEELEMVAYELENEMKEIQAEMNSITEFYRSLGDCSRAEEHSGSLHRRWVAVVARKQQWFRHVREHNKRVCDYIKENNHR